MSLYGHKWRQARRSFLADNPLCVWCESLGIVQAAEVVDHIKPHRNNLKLFWDRNNWQALCKPCHDSHKQRLEKSGRVVGCDVNGAPVDPNHHWNTN